MQADLKDSLCILSLYLSCTAEENGPQETLGQWLFFVYKINTLHGPAGMQTV